MQVMGTTADPDGTVIRFPGPKVTDTYWGYTIAEPLARSPGLAVPVLRFLGLVLVLAAYAQWLLPAAMFNGEPLLAKAALTGIFGMSGIGLYWFASRGVRRIVTVDLSRRQVRLAQRNGRGDDRVRLIQPISKVEGAVLKRAADPAVPSELFLRLKGRMAPVLIAAGGEAELLALHRRMAEDLRPMRERIEDRLSYDPGFRSVRTAMRA